MCCPTNLDKNNLTAAANNGNSLRRIHRRSHTTIAATAEEPTRNATMTSFTGMLNGVNDRTQRRRRACQGSRRPRPDARGRIGKKECHIIAFYEQFEEQIRRLADRDEGTSCLSFC